MVLVRQAVTTWRVFGAREMVDRIYRYALLRLRGVKAYQAPLTRTIVRLGSSHPTFIDVGAASGEILEVASPCFDTTVGLEPAPHHLQVLADKQARGLLGSALVLPYAAGGGAGEVQLGLSATNPDDNSAFGRSDLDRYVTVPQRSLDDIVAEHSLVLPAVVKIDVQGYESSVLDGSAALLEAGSTFLIEFWPWGLHQAGTDPGMLLRKIEERGYTIADSAGRPYPPSRLARACAVGVSNRLVVTDLLLTPPGR